MIVFRMLLPVALFSCSAVVSMEIVQRQEISIQNILNLIVVGPQGEWSDVDLVAFYLQNGGNINAKGTIWVNPPYWQKVTGMNLLMTSVHYGRARLMKFLINQCYARLDCRNEFGDTALHIAAMHGHTSLARFLLKVGANKNIRNNNGRTALDIAYNSPLRLHPFYNQKRYKNCHFPTMIKLLEPSDKTVRNYNQLRIQQ